MGYVLGVVFALALGVVPLAGCGNGSDNTAPVANAGPDLDATVGSAVTLDGTRSSDADGDSLTYSWTMASRPAGSAAALSASGTASPMFTPDVEGGYQVQLIVNDGTADSAPDAATVTAAAVFADLTVTIDSVMGDAFSVTVEYTAENLGNMNSPSDVRLDAWPDKTSAPLAEETSGCWKTIAASDLSAGSGAPGSIVCSSSLLSGTAYLSIDSGQVVSESNEANNITPGSAWSSMLPVGVWNTHSWNQCVWGP